MLLFVHNCDDRNDTVLPNTHPMLSLGLSILLTENYLGILRSLDNYIKSLRAKVTENDCVDNFLRIVSSAGNFCENL